MIRTVRALGRETAGHTRGVSLCTSRPLVADTLHSADAPAWEACYSSFQATRATPPAFPQGGTTSRGEGMSETFKRDDDGWFVLTLADGREIRVKLPPDATIADVEAFKRHLVAHLHGAN